MSPADQEKTSHGYMLCCRLVILLSYFPTVFPPCPPVFLFKEDVLEDVLSFGSPFGKEYKFSVVEWGSVFLSW